MNKNVTFLSLGLWIEKAHVRDEIAQTDWIKKNNIDILLSSLTVNTLYCICLSYCSVVECNFWSQFVFRIYYRNVRLIKKRLLLRIIP